LISQNFIGVGGLVFHENRYLLVEQAYGEYKGQWILPGGHVRSGEAIHRAVEREVLEESGIRAEATGIVAVRSRIRTPETTDCYLIWMMRYLEGIPTPDGREVAKAGFFNYTEVQQCENMVHLSRMVIQHHHARKLNILARNNSDAFYNLNHQDYQLYL